MTSYSSVALSLLLLWLLDDVSTSACPDDRGRLDMRSRRDTASENAGDLEHKSFSTDLRSLVSAWSIACINLRFGLAGEILLPLGVTFGLREEVGCGRGGGAMNSSFLIFVDYLPTYHVLLLMENF